MSSAMIEEFFQLFGEELKFFFKKRIANTEDAEDLFHDLWEKVLRNATQLSNVKQPRAWLFQIARNLLTDYYRKRKTEVVSEQAIEKTRMTNMETGMDNFNKECGAYLMHQLKNMPEKYRLPFLLHVESGWKHRQISVHLQLSESGSKTRIQRTKRKLKSALDDCCDIQTDSYGNIVECSRKNGCFAS